MKQRSARALLPRRKKGDARQIPLFAEAPSRTPLWQARFYDFNVWTARKRVEKLRYMHQNPVQRELVRTPEDWRWSSYRFYALGEAGLVRVNEGWERFRFGIVSPKLVDPGSMYSRPCKKRKDGPPDIRDVEWRSGTRKGRPPADVDFCSIILTDDWKKMFLNRVAWRDLGCIYSHPSQNEGWGTLCPGCIQRDQSLGHPPQQAQNVSITLTNQNRRKRRRDL